MIEKLRIQKNIMDIDDFGLLLQKTKQRLKKMKDNNYKTHKIGDTV